MSKTRIMMVEDERIIALHLKQRLVELNYDVCAQVASGEQALEKAEQLRPDIILMDIHLEGKMDGIEAAQAIHARFRIPVILLTAYAEVDTIKRARATLSYGYLVKPCDSRELHATLQMALTRRAAEAAVERSEERLRLALDAGQFGVWEWDTGSGRVTMGGHFEAIFAGQSQSTCDSWDAFLDRVHADDYTEVQQAFAQALAQGAAVNVLFRTNESASGTVRWIEAHGKPYADGPNAAARFVGVMKDITERRETEARLEQAAAIFETIAEGIYILDAGRRILSINPAFTEIVGYSVDEALGRDPDALLHAQRHSDEFYSRLETMEGSQWQGAIDLRHKRGNVFPVWENITAVQDDKGSVTHYVAAVSDISALRRAEADLQRLAHHDPLTGLANRLLFNDRLDQALERARREGHLCALLFLDLDGFKSINDTLGHGEGDALLKIVAERIKASLRRCDTAARLGGDEFVLIVSEITHAEDAARIAYKLLDALSAPAQLSKEQVTVGASLGLAIFPHDGTDRHALLKAADTAMYSAKARGRGQYSFYTPDMSVRAAERMGIEQGLRRALETGGLMLYYQPQVRMSDGVITGVEALVRWQHPRDGIVLPERFITIAEDSGVIEQLGRWVLQTACNEAQDWFKLGGMSPIRLAVNVSARQLARDDFPQVVQRVLDETGFPAERLELEITESTLHCLEQSRRVLGQLKGLGVQLAIDDFGIGYSSLGTLRQMPVDRLKIDRSFVRNIPADGSDVAVVEAIIGLSKTMKLQITAEGVETVAQRESLRKLGCAEGQGFLFCHPVPTHDVREFIAAGNNAHQYTPRPTLAPC